MKFEPRADYDIMRSVLDFLPMGVYVLNRRREIQWINERIKHRLERETSIQSVGKLCYKGIFMQEEPCKDCPALKTLKSGLMERKEIESQYKGTIRHYLVTTALLNPKERGVESFIIETVQDITYQKKAEEEFKRINNLNTAIIHNAPVAIFTIDREGKFMSVNPALANISGLGHEAKKKLLGFNWIENPYTVSCGLADHIKKGLKGKPFELQDFPFVTYRDNSQHVYMHFLGVPLKDKDGKIDGLLCIIEDTTEKVKSRMQLIQDAKMSVIGRLMTGVAHELNNPLATIAANSEFASELLQGVKADSITKNETRELREYLHTIEDQVFRCKSVIDDMIDITKKSGLEIKKIDMRTCINVPLKVMNLKKNKIRVIKEIAHDLPFVKGDLDALKQCLTNLLQNAVDALEEQEKKVINIRVYPANAMVKIEIEDNGAGIHEEVLDKIFEPFFSTKNIGKNVGLGLTLCYELINRMDGTITAGSSLGKGSIFTITLPSFPKNNKGQKNK